MDSPLRHLAAKLFLLLLGVMLVVFGINAWLGIRTTSSTLTSYVYASADRASDLIVRSTRYGMLLNRKEDVHEIIRTIGSEPGFVGINIYNKTGDTVFSTDSTLVGRTVDLRGEACVICHASGAPLVSVPATSRMRVYESPHDGRVLGLIQPIRNEPACSRAACHAHSTAQTVLGVLDVKMSLAAVDAQVGKARTSMILSSLGMMLVITSVSGLFIYRMIRRPIQRLICGMNRIAAGNLDTRIDVDSHDEIGELATSFNKMTDDLAGARNDLEGWAHTLEDRIATKTDELQQVQGQVIHMEKMASLGKLSASVAHEINNPLFGILTYAKVLLRDLDSGHVDPEAIPEMRKCLTAIQKESSRCGDIVKSLLDFARRSGGRFSEQHLNDIVEQVMILLVHHFEMRGIAVTRELMEGGDDLVCDGKQIQQAIIAPCINAVEAMKEGGSFTIRTEGNADAVSIIIRDTGHGIPEDVLPHIFEPFYTTKESESGTGLGLAVTYGIVQRHQGRIDVKSVPGQGTAFTIILPRAPRVQPEAGPQEDVATAAPLFGAAPAPRP